jgi:signal transduction histidine kinase
VITLNFKGIGLRSRLTVSLAAVALLAVVLAALIGNLGLTSRLDQAARTRLADSATHVADIAATAYEGSSGWTRDVTVELGHVAALDGLRIELLLPNDRRIDIGPRPTGATSQAVVSARGKRLAVVVVSTIGGNLLTAGDRSLRDSLDQLHMIAAAVAVLVALLIGILLAQTLTRPLRRIRAAAERLELGQLDARVEVGNEPEMRAIGRALNRLAETLAHEEELRKESVADLAHELRTPVNGMLTRIEAAQDGVLPLEQNLAAMHDEVLRLTRLLNDLARLGDAERPGLLLEKRPLDLSEVGSAVAQSYEPRFNEADIGFSLNLSLEPVVVSGDPGRLEQILANLLQNALYYSEPGGEVTLRVAQSGSDALLEVTDTGIGIEPEDLRHIYTRFWRGDRSRSRATGGTGIGLAIVHELVRAHEGRIDVDSAPGRGSRFRVVLPVLTPQSVTSSVRNSWSRSPKDSES